MFKGTQGKMTVDFHEYYNQEEDVYYVTFKTGEPSYAKELNDDFILELGMFSHRPTGFRILNFKKAKIGGVQLAIRKMRKTVEDMARAHPIKETEDRLEQVLEKVLA